MSETTIETLSPLAMKTLRRLNEALDSGQTGAMPEIVQTVRKLSGQIATVSIQDLSEIIERDPSVTEKVISAANTFGFNPSGAEICSITQAIHTVGFERIRNLTLSVMLAQNAGKGMDSEQQREMAALSVCSGMLAQNLVAGSDLFCSDPDIAFVSGTLRNYGKLLMSTFFLDEFLEAKDLARQSDGDSAYHDIFGLSPLDLGHTLLLGTNLPDLIMASLEKVSSDKLGRTAESESEEILLAAEFCVKVCELAFDDQLDPEAFQEELNAVVQTFSHSLPVDFEMVINGLAEVDTTLAQLNEVIGIKATQSPANKALGARLNGKQVVKAKSPQKREMGIGRVDCPQQQSLADILEKLEGQGSTLGDEELGDIYLSLNAAIAAELNIEGCMTFLKDPETMKGVRFSARYGVGPLYGRIKNRPLVSSDKKDLFAICLNRREDILIQDTQVGKIASVIPEWIHEKGQAKSLFVMPTSAGSTLFAIFVAVKTGDEVLEIEPVTLKRLRQFRSRLAALRKPD